MPMKKLLVLTLLLIGSIVSSGCSVQQASLASAVSVVEVTYEQPDGDTPVGIRTTIAGTGERVTVNDYDFEQREPILWTPPSAPNFRADIRATVPIATNH